MSAGDTTTPGSVSGYREAKAIYRVLFAVGLFVLGGSILLGFAQTIRVLGAPPLAVDATVLGRALISQQDFAGAIGEFRLANIIDPTGYPSLPELTYPAPSHPDAAALVAQGRAAIRQRPDDASAHLRLGSALLLAGGYAESISSLQRALDLDLDPAYSRAHKPMGRAFLLEGNALGAERSFQQALEREPLNPALYEDLGVALYRLGRLKEAAAAFERASELRTMQDQAPEVDS